MNRFIKSLSVIFIMLSLFSIGASANEYSGWRSNTVFYSGDPMIVYADSSQWDRIYDSNTNSYYWMCETPDFYQGYTNAWIYTNGKWYYVRDDGQMEYGVLVGDKHKKERYLLDDNGAMVVNQYWDQFGSSNYIDTNGLVHLPDIYYQMMPN